MIQGGAVDYGSHLPVPVAMPSGEAEYIASVVAWMRSSHLRMLGYDIKYMDKENYNPIEIEYDTKKGCWFMQYRPMLGIIIC